TSARLFMELVTGRNLGEMLRGNSGKRFPFERVLDWGITLCELLHTMHTLDPPWIYRDMKPDHLILQEDGRSLKVIDFGSARPLSLQAQPQRRTRVITDGYSPPEQYLGRPVPQSDLFSLSATLFQLATGKQPDGIHTGLRLAEELALTA